MSSIVFNNNMFPTNFSWLITEDELLILSPITFSSEVPISSREILIVYKNTWFQEAAPLESIIRHRNLDTLGMFEAFEVEPPWDGKKIIIKY